MTTGINHTYPPIEHAYFRKAMGPILATIIFNLAVLQCHSLPTTDPTFGELSISKRAKIGDKVGKVNQNSEKGSKRPLRYGKLGELLSSEKSKFEDLYGFCDANMFETVTKTGHLKAGPLKKDEYSGVHFQSLFTKLEIIGVTAQKEWWCASVSGHDYQKLKNAFLKGIYDIEGRTGGGVTDAQDFFTKPLWGLDLKGNSVSVVEAGIVPCPKDIIYFGVSFPRTNTKYIDGDKTFEKTIASVLRLKMKDGQGPVDVESFDRLGRPRKTNPQVSRTNLQDYYFTKMLRVVQDQTKNEKLEYWDGGSETQPGSNTPAGVEGPLRTIDLGAQKDTLKQSDC